MTAIENKDFEAEKVQKYVEHHFDYIDTHASDRVIDWLILGNLPEETVEELKEVELANQRMNEMLVEFYDDEKVNEGEDTETDTDAETDTEEN